MVAQALCWCRQGHAAAGASLTLVLLFPDARLPVRGGGYWITLLPVLRKCIGCGALYDPLLSFFFYRVGNSSRRRNENRSKKGTLDAAPNLQQKKTERETEREVSFRVCEAVSEGCGFGAAAASGNVSRPSSGFGCRFFFFF